jgi:hypothetical protein
MAKPCTAKLLSKKTKLKIMQQLKPGKIKKWLTLAGCLLLLALATQAQTGTTVSGTVTTEAGELLNGVSVDIKATENKTSYNTTTNEFKSRQRL